MSLEIIPGYDRKEDIARLFTEYTNMLVKLDREFGRHLGSFPMMKVVDDARMIGYSHMLLDTLPGLIRAVEKYRRYIFIETDSYNGSPMDGLICMKLDL